MDILTLSVAKSIADKKISAYDQAVAGGYTGTEEEFSELMASYATVAETANNIIAYVEDLGQGLLPKKLAYTYLYEGKALEAYTGKTYDSANFAVTNKINISGINRIIYSRIKTGTSTSPKHGMTFYNANEEYISGIRSSFGAEATISELYEIDVPEGAVYAQFTWRNEDNRTTFGDFEIYDAEQYHNNIQATLLRIEDQLNFTDLQSEAPQSKGVQDAILRAKQLTQIEWTPVLDMPGLLKVDGNWTYKTFKAGVHQKGIPYSNVLNYDNYVGHSISLGTFATAVTNPNSVLYSNNLYSSSSNKSASYYGIVCSKFAQYVWGLPELYHTQSIESLPGLTKIANAGEYTENDIQLGDGIIDPTTHSTIVTDILRNPHTGKIFAIEISEAVPPTCRTVRWSLPDFFEHFADYNLYRFSGISDVTYVKSDFVDLGDGKMGIINPPISIRLGSFINVDKDDPNGLLADVDASKWTTINYVRNGVTTTEEISSSQVSLDISQEGYVEVYPTDGNNHKGESSYYYVFTASVSNELSGNDVTITYSCELPAKFIQWDSRSSQSFTYLDGTGVETVTKKGNAFRIAFESEYGYKYTQFYNVV